MAVRRSNTADKPHLHPLRAAFRACPAVVCPAVVRLLLALILPAFAIVAGTGTGNTQPTPPRENPPATSRFVSPHGVAYLPAAWLRVTPPDGWARVVASEPYELAFEKPSPVAGQSPGTLAMRAQPLPGDLSAAEIAANPTLREWLADPPWQPETPRASTAILGVPAAEVTATRTTSAGTVARKTLVVAVHANTAVIMVGELGTISDWYRPERFEWLDPVPGCTAMAGLPGDGGGVPIPNGFAIRFARKHLIGATLASEGAVAIHFLAGALPCPSATDLDAAFGPLERQFETAHGITRTDGRAFPANDSALAEALDVDGFLFRGHARPAANAPNEPRAVVGWYGFQREHSRLLALLIDGPPARLDEMESLLRDSIIPHLLAPPTGHRDAHSIAGRIATLGLVGAPATDAMPAQLAIVFLDANGIPVAFASTPVTLELRIDAAGETLHIIGPLSATASADFLPTGDFADALALTADQLAAWPADGVTLTATATFADSATPLTATAPLRPLLAAK